MNWRVSYFDSYGHMFDQKEYDYKYTLNELREIADAFTITGENYYIEIIDDDKRVIEAKVYEPIEEGLEGIAAKYATKGSTALEAMMNLLHNKRIAWDLSHLFANDHYIVVIDGSMNVTAYHEKSGYTVHVYSEVTDQITHFWFRKEMK